MRQKFPKIKTGVDCDGFDPKVPLDSAKETRKEVVEFLEKKKQCDNCPQQVCTTRYFLIPKTITSERSIALMSTTIRWWEVLRTSEVTKKKNEYRLEWDVTDGRTGGAQRIVWEIMMEMEKFKNQAEEESGSPCPGFGPGKGVWAGQSPSGLSLGNVLQCSEARSCECFVDTWFSLKDVWRSRSRPSRLSCQGQKGVACFCVLRCRILWVKLQRFICHWNRRFLWTTSQHSWWWKVRKLLKWQTSDEKVKRGCGGRGFQTVGHRGWKRRKGWDDCFVWLLGGRAASRQQRRSDDDRQCWNSPSGPENTNQAIGSEREGKKKKVRCEILAHQENSGLPEKLHEDWCERAVEDRFGSRESGEDKPWASRPQRGWKWGGRW